MTISKFKETITEEAIKINKIGYTLPKHYSIIITEKTPNWVGKCTKLEDSYTLSFRKDYIEKEKEEYVRYTIAHELLHSLPNCMKHTGEWKTAANSYNQAYNAQVQRVAIDSDFIEEQAKAKANYAIQCVDCGKVYYRQKETKDIRHPEYYRCKCGGKLIRAKI